MRSVLVGICCFCAATRLLEHLGMCFHLQQYNKMLGDERRKLFTEQGSDAHHV